MIFEQLADPGLGCLSYLIGDEGTGEAIVVDPLEKLGVDLYIQKAAERGLAITQVVDTHLHADHVSIGRRLAEAAGAPYRLSKDASVNYSFDPLGEGDTFELGPLVLKVLMTPGHTPDGLSLLATDTSRGREPWFVLTGDSLFIGDVARPDLILPGSDETPETRAAVLYRTLFETLLALPDTVEVYPGHYGASTCGGRYMSGKTVSTIGFERRYNIALKEADERSFTHFVMAGLKPLPDRYEEIKRKNLGVTSDRV